MKRICTNALSAALLAAFVVGCTEKDDAPETATDKAAPQTAKNTDTAAAESSDTDTNEPDSEQGDPDAGAISENGRIAISDPPKVNELAELAALLRRRSKELDLREREIAEREQMMAGLETASMRQVDVLFKLKDEVSVLMEKLGKDFEAERKLYQEKQQKEAAARLTREKEAAAAAATEAANRRKMARELAEKREQQTIQLTAAIKGMRPSSGASMLASMDEMDAVSVLRQLGARQAAALLGNMPPEKAARLAESMLGPKPTPADVAPPPPDAPQPDKPDSKDKKTP